MLASRSSHTPHRGISARLRAAHTIHGCYTAEARAVNRKILTQAGCRRIALEAIRRLDRLLPELVARLNSLPPELMPAPWPIGGLTRAQDQAARQAEAANLAPWKRAIAAANGRPHAARSPRLAAYWPARPPR